MCALNSTLGGSLAGKGSSVPLFDDMLAGSLPAASVLALIGALGTGTSVMCTSFMANALRKGRKILFVAFDYDLTLSNKYFASIGFDTKPYLDDGRLIMIDAGDITYAKMGISRSYEIENLRQLTSEEIIDTFQKDVLDKYHVRPDQPISYVLDSFTASAPFIDIRSAYHLATEICSSVKGQGASALLVAHEGVLEGNLVNALTRSVDGIIRLRMLWRKTGLVREALVEKQSFATTQDTSEEYEITNNGIRVNAADSKEQAVHNADFNGTLTVRREQENVPPAREGRFSTGVPELDVKLQGGFPRGAFICLKGDVGTGTSTFCTQFAWSRLRANGRVAYYCADEPPDNVNRRFKSFGWNLEPYLENNRISLVDAFTFLTRELSHAGKQPNDVDAKKRALTAFMIKDRESVRNVFGKTPVSVIVDSFTALAPYIDLKSSYVLARMTANSTRQRDETYLAVVRSGVVEANLFYACMGSADALIDMKNTWMQRNLVRKMRIDKMAFTSTPRQPLEYQITGEGIKLVSGEKS
jgi:KaiC/GvpD/RAD55 family RecA-like ATPase